MKNGIEMALEPRDILTGAEWLIAAGTLMTAIALGIKKVYRLARNVETSMGMLDAVQKQLSPNGGTSIHDKVNKIVATQADFSEAISNIHSRLDRLEEVAMRATSRDKT